MRNLQVPRPRVFSVRGFQFRGCQFCCRQRRGATLVVVMVSLLICSMILSSILLLQTRAYRQLQREEEALQADLYADAGLERAMIRLGKDREYRGEEWKPAVGSGSADQTGLVKIRVTRLESSVPRTAEGDRVEELKIEITARFPMEGENPPQRVRELKVRRTP